MNNNNEKKKQFFWIFYIVAIFIIFILILLLLKGCNNMNKGKYDEIINANDWVTNMWNKCVDPIYWYSVDGTGIEGAAIDLDQVLTACDTYYAEYKNHTDYVNSLRNEYTTFKDYFAKAVEQIEIIYPKIKATRPMSKTVLGYESNIEVYYEYQLKLYEEVKNKYMETK